MDISTGIILCAGHGQKLDPLHTHKALLQVYGKPILARQILQMHDAGIRRIVLITGEFTKEIQHGLMNQLSSDIDITYVEDLPEGLGIFGSMQAGLAFAREGAFVSSGDLLFENNPFDLKKSPKKIQLVVDKRIQKNKFAGATIGVRTGAFGSFELESDIKKQDAFVTGIYVIPGSEVQHLSNLLNTCGMNDSVSELIDRLREEKTIEMEFLSEMHWFDINTPETWIRAELMLRRVHESIHPSHVNTDNLQTIEPTHSFLYRRSDQTNILLKRGLLSDVGSYRLMKDEQVTSRHILLTDGTVDGICANAVYEQLISAGYDITKFVIPEREEAKTMEVYNAYAEKIIAQGIDENSIVFAVGGGAVSNLAGFLASTLYRGIGLIHIPTTIMNMIDVSISLKQGINGQNGKNLVGSYYQPSLVLIDPTISMPNWLVQDGISEAIKHAICQDEAFFDYLLNYTEPLQDIDFRERLIAKTIELKIELMEQDMFEHHRGFILQYGHEIGHAMEFLSGFELSHGEGIAIGMRVSAELARLMDVTDDETVEKHRRILRHFGLPESIPEDISPEAILDSLQFNKKNLGKDIRIVLPERIGKVWKVKGEFGIPCSKELIQRAISRSYS